MAADVGRGEGYTFAVRPGQRTALAVLLSLAIHVAVAIWLGTRPPREALPEPPERTLMTFEYVTVPPPPSADGSEADDTPETPEARPERSPRVRAAPITRAAPPSATPGDGTSSGASAGSPPLPVPMVDAPIATDDEVPNVPRLKSLLPENPRIAEIDGTTLAPAPSGRTLVNDGSGPSPEVTAALDALAAKEKIDGWIQDDLASLRVESGVVDDYFRELKDRLAEGASKPPSEAAPGNTALQKLMAQYAQGLERYGATGNPYAEPPTMDRSNSEFGSPLAQAIQNNPQMQAVKSRFEAAATVRDFADARFGGKLVVILEVRQKSTGELYDTKVLQSSGNELFDQFVLATAPGSINAAGPLPEHLRAQKPNGLRSVWAFSGRLIYKRKLSEFDLSKPEDVAYLAALGFTSLLTGGFDETTGEIEVVDFRNPKFVTSVTLLRVY